MHIFAFLDNYTFSIEPVTNRRYRLIIYKNGEEHVCRKESLYKLKQFLSADEGRAFKGRLQLLKHGDEIAVEVKGELIGNISKATLLTSLEA
jgi:hypothetical protein